MKKNICLVSLLLIFSTGHAQLTFQQVIGSTVDDNVFSLSHCSDGGYLLAGYQSDSLGINNIYLVKTNGLGDTLWTRVIGGPGPEDAWFAGQTPDGGFLAAGSTAGFGAGGNDVYVLKTDGSGTPLWFKTYGDGGSQQGLAACLTSDSGMVITGSAGGTGADNLLLMKVDSTGNLSWAKIIGGINFEQGYSVDETADGGFVITGVTFSYGAGLGDVWLIKTDAAGNIQWSKTYGGSDGDVGYSVRTVSDHGFILTGYSSSFGTANADVYLIKTDSLGNLQWSKLYSGPNADYGYSVLQTPDGGYIVSGITISFFSVQSNYLLRTDNAGNLMWSKIYTQASQYFDSRSPLLQTTDGGFMTASSSNLNFSGSRDIYWIKTDSSGSSGCHEQNPSTVLVSPATQLTPVNALAVTPVFVTNSQAPFLTGSSSLIRLCYNNPTSIQPPGEYDNRITLFPNPARNEIRLNVPWPVMDPAKIYAVTGRLVLIPLPDKDGQTIHVSSLVAGIYLIKVSGKNEEHVIKFIKY